MARYEPKTAEPRQQARWAAADAFVTPEGETGRPKYYVLEMFPYPSGNIHMGHARNYVMGDVVARFKREVATLASCDHPNVVKILDSGFEKGEYYYAMEYIDGVTLADLYSRMRNLAKDKKSVSDEEWRKARDELILKGHGSQRATELAEKDYYEFVALSQLIPRALRPCVIIPL